MNKKILFLTGTRADYGKLKPLIQVVDSMVHFECFIFITGMHTLSKYGSTKEEILKDGFKNIQVYMNQIIEEPMDLVLANTINGLSRYIREVNPDMIVVHGDRLETLAGAIVGSFNNIFVAHIEGGEVSGTIDESIRHSVTKLAHFHFVTNQDARERLLQMGEDEDSIFVIGSPDLDILFRPSVIPFDLIKLRYEIPFDTYGILIYHPVTTELDLIEHNTQILVDAVIASDFNYIVIYPNNDPGQQVILNQYQKIMANSRFRIYPSLRFEYFVEILKRARFIIGNSSVGIHEAPALGIPTINVGSRQRGRFSYQSILDCELKKEDILESINKAVSSPKYPGTKHFGTGESQGNFMKVISEESLWQKKKQKKFIDRVSP